MFLYKTDIFFQIANELVAFFYLKKLITDI